MEMEARLVGSAGRLQLAQQMLRQLAREKRLLSSKRDALDVLQYMKNETEKLQINVAIQDNSQHVHLENVDIGKASSADLINAIMGRKPDSHTVQSSRVADEQSVGEAEIIDVENGTPKNEEAQKIG